MTILNIYSLDDTEQKNLIASLGEGNHTIGRGGFLHVRDHRVSRNHAVIQVTHDLITLTSVHVNPCFFKKANNNEMSIIRKDGSHELKDGDTFALLPQEYWFKVKIQNDEPPKNVKRSGDASLESIEPKKVKLSITNPNEASTSRILEDSTLNILEQPHEETSDDAFNFRIVDVSTVKIEKENEEVKPQTNEEHDAPEASSNLNILEPQTHELELVAGNVVDNHNPEENVQIKQEPPEPEAQAEINTEAVNLPTTSAESGNATSASSVRRERCWYAAACFRKNPNHRQQFSHPGDTDYDSDPDDNRPDCPYGAACYRRNPEHRREYKHSSAKPAPKPNATALPQNRQVTPPQTPDDDDLDDATPSPTLPPKRQATKKTLEDDDLDDSYDYDDPFINDASSDDYQPSHGIDSSDTDWEDSQEQDEESQEIKRTIREGKKFTKNKKK